MKNKENKLLKSIEEGIKELEQLSNIMIQPNNLNLLIDNFKESKEEIKQLEEKKFKEDYINIMNNPMSNHINLSLSIKNITEYDMHNNGILKADNIEYKINDFDILKHKIKISTCKLFRYSIYKLDVKTNKSVFTLSEYSKICKKNNAGIRRQILNKINPKTNKKEIGDLDLLKKITDISYQKGEELQFSPNIIYKTIYKNGLITIYFDSDFAESLKYFMYIPKEIFSINDKDYQYAYKMISFFFEHAKINKKNIFKLKINTIMKKINMPSKKYVKKHKNRAYDKFIIKPFYNNLAYLNKNFDININPTPIENNLIYEDIDTFLKETITIEMTNEILVQKYKSIKEKQLKHSIKHNKQSKAENKKKTLILTKEGKTKKEITTILKKDIRTIDRYLKELKLEGLL